MIKDLTLIILGVIISHAYFYWQSYKDKKEIKKQERLNQSYWNNFDNINKERNKRHD
jgi:uncharacterized protein YpmB